MVWVLRLLNRITKETFMTTLTIELTAAQEKGLAYVAASCQDWAENAVHNRCRIAIDEIYDMEVARMTADPEITSIPADKDAERNAAAESDLPE